MQQVCIIVNPVAGKGRAKLAAKLFEQELKKHAGIRYEVRESAGPKDPVRLANQATVSGFDVIVAVGGDGTIGEVVNGIVTDSNHTIPVLGVLPAGTGNDFARGMRLATDPIVASKSLVNALVSGHCRQVDALRLEDSHGTSLFAINSIGIGFDAAVARAVKESQVNKTLGHLSYAYSVFHCLRTFKTFPFSISARRIDETARQAREFHECWLVACTNTQRLGGGIRINPAAVPSDGEFDLCIGHSIPAIKLALLLPLAFFGAHRNVTGASFMRCFEAVLTFPPGTPIHIDGDPVQFESPLKITTLHGSIQLLDTVC